jgi:hypothetical protein
LAGLIVDAHGDLFGTTTYGGASYGLEGDGYGTVFEIAKTAHGYASTPTTLVSFPNGTNGLWPVAGLIADAHGDLFGTTSAGPPYPGSGTVFEITDSGFIVAPTVQADRAHVQEGQSLKTDAAHGVLANDTDPIRNDIAGSGGTLTLDDTQAYTGTVAGLAPGNHIDLADISFGAHTTLGYTPNDSNSGGVLTAGDGSHVAKIALLGQYAAASFVMASDGHGGALITDPPELIAQTQLTKPHG